MQRAVQAVQQSRRYATLSWEMLKAVTEKLSGKHHPLLASRPRQRVLLVLMTSNRGLAGGFNSKVCDAARSFIAEELADGVAVDVVTVGRKGRETMAKFSHNVVADFVMGDRKITIDEVLPMARLVMDDFLAGKYGAVVVAYTDFVSMLRQEPVVREILPLRHAERIEGHAVIAEDEDPAPVAHVEDTGEYWYEPTPAVVLDTLVPRLIEMQLYQAVVESKASEQAARMVAMRNATDAAGDIIGDLTLTYNQLRQSAITQELAEISAGRIALGV